jgi:hypothetical protein
MAGRKNNPGPGPTAILRTVPDSQGLIRYISEASKIARANFNLERLGRAANARSALFNLVQGWVIACAYDPKQLPAQGPFKRELYSLIEEIGDAYGQMWAVRVVSQYEEEGRALPRAAKGRQPRLRQGNGVHDVTALDPFFRPRQESNAIRRQQTVTQRNLWALYYERYGCLRCQGKDKAYESNGLCVDCHGTIASRRKGLLDGKRKWRDFGG